MGRRLVDMPMSRFWRPPGIPARPDLRPCPLRDSCPDRAAPSVPRHPLQSHRYCTEQFQLFSKDGVNDM